VGPLSSPGQRGSGLYQTGDLVSLWQRTELAGQAEQEPPFWASAWAGPAATS
jgi:predicted nicotinamide N-methyase